MNAVELLFDYFEDHVKATATVVERKPLALGVLCFLIGGLSLFVGQGLANRMHLFSFSWASCGLTLIWKLCAGFTLAAMVHIIVEMGGATGSAASLFVLFGMADLAWAVVVPLLLLARMLGSGSSWLVTAVFLGVGFYTVVLKVRGIQDNYRVSSGRAWISLGLPYVAVVATALLAVSLAVVEVVLKLVQSMD